MDDYLDVTSINMLGQNEDYAAVLAERYVDDVTPASRGMRLAYMANRQATDAESQRLARRVIEAALWSQRAPRISTLSVLGLEQEMAVRSASELVFDVAPWPRLREVLAKWDGIANVESSVAAEALFRKPVGRIVLYNQGAASLEWHVQKKFARVWGGGNFSSLLALLPADVRVVYMV